LSEISAKNFPYWCESRHMSRNGIFDVHRMISSSELMWLQSFEGDPQYDIVFNMSNVNAGTIA